MRFWPALLLALAHPLLAQEVSESVAVTENGSRTMTHEILIAAPREEVWRAVGTVEGWAEWAVPVARPIEGTARFETSYDPAAEPGSPQTIEQEWLEREMPNRVVFRTTRTRQAFPMPKPISKSSAPSNWKRGVRKRRCCASSVPPIRQTKRATPC